MANGVEEFEAGNDFADLTVESMAAEEAPKVDLPPRVDTREGGVEIPDEMPAEPAVSADGELLAETTESPAADAIQSISIKGDGREREFKLDPEDQELQKALQWGLAAPRFVKERKEALERTKQVEKKLAKLDTDENRGKIEVMDEINDLFKAGEYDDVARLLFGEQYDAYVQWVGQYQAATPDQQLAYERERIKREAGRTRGKADKTVQADREALAAEREQMAQDKFTGWGRIAQKKYDFSSVFDDVDLAEDYSELLWEGAWNDIRKAADGDESKVTPRLVDRAFKRRFRRMSAGGKRLIDSKVQAKVDQKKEEAISTLQAETTQHYEKPGTAASAASGWNGKSSKDLLKRLITKG
jgi:hypothetical protein